MPPDLSVGDFVYQADQELFLVVVDEYDDSYRFAVHGWRDIGKDRLDEYVSHTSGKLYSQEKIDSMVEEEAADDTRQTYETMKEMFRVYEKADLSDDGPHTEFLLDDT
jgi:hypothetical protein